jgi:NTE family protein
LKAVYLVFQFLSRRPKGSDRAVDTAASEPPGPRPSIGLALGGGAARGFAHIGVIRTLVARGFIPDVITGTSIGAVIGGCFAAGRLDSIEQWARGLTRRRLLGYLDLSFSGSGLINGAKLAEHLEHDIGDIKIDQLEAHFAAIATEVGTGHEIWLTRGRLADAMRASYALPGIFAPVHIAGRWLMDGALVNPVPVSAARALGARLVIAVNLNSDLLGRGATIPDHGAEPEPPAEPPSDVPRSPAKSARRQFFGTPSRPGISTVMVEAFNIMQDRVTRARLAGDPPDVLINPRLGRVGLFDFHRAVEAIEIGAEAAEQALEPVADALAALA